VVCGSSRYLVAATTAAFTPTTSISPQPKNTHHQPQDNQLCTLKGSLTNLRFLTHLDLSNNVLRDLPKLLARLERLRFLRHLNLQGNPCCEEPDYRLEVIHRLLWLEVLDWHQGALCCVAVPR